MTLKSSIHLLIYYCLFLLLSFLLPLYARAVPFVIILIVINWLAEGRFTWKFRQYLHTRKSSVILSFAILYLVYVISLLYSNNFRLGVFELEVTLSLLLFPVIFATIDRDIFTRNRVDNIFLAFCAGCLLASLLMLCDASVRFMRSYDINEFIYTKLAASKHPSYMAMYFCLTVAIIANYLLGRWESSSNKLRSILVLLLFYFSFIILLLSSKAGIIALIIVFLVFTIYSFQRKDHSIPGIILSLLAITFILSTFYLFPSTMGRFGQAFGTLRNFENIDSDNTESTAVRILIWDSAFEACMEKPVTGHGIGDVKEELGIIYQKNQLYKASRLNLNAHNQYLQTFLATGLIGIVILLLSLLLPIIKSFNKKNILYAVFLLIIGSNFLFESMLCRQAGVVFYAFFNAFFLFSFEGAFKKPMITSAATRYDPPGFIPGVRNSLISEDAQESCSPGSHSSS